MIVERLTDGAIGVRCDECHKSLFLHAENPIKAARYLGWHIGGERHEDEHYCPKCKKGGKQ